MMKSVGIIVLLLAAVMYPHGELSGTDNGMQDLSLVHEIKPKDSDKDFEIIYGRMYEDNAGNPSEKSVAEILENINDDGSFKGIDYTMKGDAPRAHVKMMQTLAKAYTCPENRYFKDKGLLDAYLRTLDFWLVTDHTPDNWWFRCICYPQELNRSVVLMADEIGKNIELFDRTMSYLRAKYEEGKHMEGANGTDMIKGAMLSSVLRKDRGEMLEYKERMTALMTIQPKHGITVDGLFAQHGPQLYFANYGKEYVLACLEYLETCRGTEYDIPEGTELLRNLYVNGVQWIYFSRHYDPNNAGRFISSEKYREQVMERGERLCALKDGKDEELNSAVWRIKGENSLEGNRMFWKYDYMVHRRSNYMTSARMTSTRTVGNEAGNGDGEFNYYSSNGVNYIFATGKEYSGNFFSKFNNRQYPGITAAQDNEDLPIPNWGRDGGNGNAYAGGASDGRYGATGMILDRRQLRAHKGWFFFDGAFVCLGAGITETMGKGPVYTTLNQTNLAGKVFHKGNTVWHSDIGYANLDPDAEMLLDTRENLFRLNINHGVSPQGDSYSYLVVPGIDSPKEITRQVRRMEIISNTEKIQAVRDTEADVVEVVFYESGELNLSGKDRIAVDAPCVLVWNRKAGTISVADPCCGAVGVITATFTLKDKTSVIEFSLPAGEYAGSSVTRTI